jgi:DNA gyrase subunit A
MGVIVMDLDAGDFVTSVDVIPDSMVGEDEDAEEGEADTEVVDAEVADADEEADE